jgi:uncharacterized protein (TIGR00288 family)
MRYHRAGDGERTLAVFIDFENLALGFHGRRDRFQIEKVLERLVEKGKIVAKKAYADWSRFGNYAGSLHESAIELIEIPKRSMTGKNSADIRLVVDAVDLAYSKDHIDTFVIVSGDSDFSPLVSKLKELGKHVIGLGLVEATSNLLRDNCDEFIYYEDLDRSTPLQMGEMPALPEAKRKVFGLLLESLLALRRENKEVIYSSMAKDTMKRKRPSFNEEYFGYRTFSDLLEDATRFGLIEIEKHKTSGTYVISRFGGEIRSPTVPSLGPVLPHPQPMALPQRSHPVESEPVRERSARNEPRPEPRPTRPNPRSDTPVRPPLSGASRSQPIAPAPPPLSPPPPSRPIRVQEEEEVLPLGRSLIDDVDDEDDDELPSYGPPRTNLKPSAPAPAAKPAAAKRAPAGKPPAKKAAPAKPVKTARAATTKTVVPPAAPAVAASPPAPKPPAPKPVPPPPKTVDEDSFGAGLEESS